MLLKALAPGCGRVLSVTRLQSLVPGLNKVVGDWRIRTFRANWGRAYLSCGNGGAG
ncbi:protein of unknown function (plasmid) [Ralstonia solanacearum PSI07]|nr:protein of unknown function [Ralstonia solanacearum PSI07]